MMKTLEYEKEPVLSPAVQGEVWELQDDWPVVIRGVPLTIPKGYLTDGASIPRFLWRICGHPMSTARLPVAIVHDAIYDGTIGAAAYMPPYTRKEADAVYRDALIERGFGKWKARLEYAALRMFGGGHWKS